MSQSSFFAKAPESKGVVDKVDGKSKIESFRLCFLLKALGRNHVVNCPV
jgi:hypothetical protein